MTILIIASHRRIPRLFLIFIQEVVLSLLIRRFDRTSRSKLRKHVLDTLHCKDATVKIEIVYISTKYYEILFDLIIICPVS